MNEWINEWKPRHQIKVNNRTVVIPTGLGEISLLQWSATGYVKQSVASLMSRSSRLAYNGLYFFLMCVYVFLFIYNSVFYHSSGDIVLFLLCFGGLCCHAWIFVYFLRKKLKLSGRERVSGRTCGGEYSQNRFKFK